MISNCEWMPRSTTRFTCTTYNRTYDMCAAFGLYFFLKSTATERQRASGKRTKSKCNTRIYTCIVYSVIEGAHTIAHEFRTTKRQNIIQHEKFKIQMLWGTLLVFILFTISHSFVRCDYLFVFLQWFLLLLLLLFRYFSGVFAPLY